MKSPLRRWLISFREPVVPCPIRRRDVITGVLVSLLAFFVYGLTLAPTISGEDSGELVTAAWELGVAHPPGYPLWCLTSYPFARLLPFGDVAYRVNLASAVFSAAAIFVLFLLTLKLTRSRWAAAGGALLFAFSFDHWSQSVIAEVYALNTFLIVVLSYLLVLWRERRDNRLLLLFSLVYGLSLTNHHTAALLGPIFVSFVLLIEPRLILRGRLVLGCLLLAALGLSVYAYLPIRSSAEPYVNWGSPTSWEKMVDHIAREQYKKPGSQVAPRTVEKTLGQLGALWEHFQRQFTLWLVPLVAAGWVLLSRRDRLAWLYLSLIAAACTLGIIAYTNFDLDREGIHANRIFFIPAYFCAAIFAAAALASAERWVRKGAAALQARWAESRPRLGRGLQLGFLSLLIWPAAVPLAAHFEENDLSRYYYAYDYGVNLLQTMEQDAIIFPSADHTTFPLIYLQRIEGRRPDVIHADKYGYIEESLYADMPRAMQLEMAPLAGEAKRYFIQDTIIRKFAPRPAYFTIKRDITALEGFEMVPEGLLFKVQLKKEKPIQDKTLDEIFKPETEGIEESEALWASYVRRDLEGEAACPDFTAEVILTDYHYARGWEYLRRGDWDAAKAEFEAISGVASDLKQTFNNIGAALAEFQLFEDSRRYFERAMALDPNYLSGAKNLAASYFTAGEHEEALGLYEELAEKDRSDPVVWLRRGQCLRALGRSSDALQSLRKAATTMPSSAIPYREMALLYLEDFEDSRSAWLAARDALKRRPHDSELRELFERTSSEVASPPKIPDPLEDIPGFSELPGMARPRMQDPLEELMGLDPFGKGSPQVPRGSRPGLPEIPEPDVPGLPGGKVDRR